MTDEEENIEYYWLIGRGNQEGRTTRLRFLVSHDGLGEIPEGAYNVVRASSIENEPPPIPIIDFDVIKEEVSNHFKVSVEDMRSHKRDSETTMARHVAMYIARKSGYCFYASIGRAFNKTHGAVMHGCEKVEKEMERDEVLRRKVSDLCKRILDRSN